MTPPHAHMVIAESTRIGFFATVTFGFTGTHEDVVTGTHGIGVKIPKCDAVAAATTGFPKQEHIPKGKIFKKGTCSITDAAGRYFIVTRLIGKTINGVGAAPKEHLQIAVKTTGIPMIVSPD